MGNQQPKSASSSTVDALNMAISTAIQSSSLNCTVATQQVAGFNIAGNKGSIDISNNTINQTSNAKVVCTIDSSQQTKLSNDVKNALKQKADAMAEGIRSPSTRASVKTVISNIIDQNNFQSAAGDLMSAMSQTAVQNISDNTGNIVGRSMTINQNTSTVLDGIVRSKQLQDTVQKVANAIDNSAESKTTGIKGGAIAGTVIGLLMLVALIVGVAVFIRYKMAMARTGSQQMWY